MNESIPGLYFIGLTYMYKRKLSLLLGIQEDAAFVASNILKIR
jgi:hypothetical protein